MRGFRLDWFLWALLGVVALGILWPTPGAKGGFLHIEWVTTYGVAVVFFLYGLTLAPERLIRGMWHWRLHLVVQVATFVLFPLLVVLAHAAFASLYPPEVWTGFFFIAAVPSTVSSSVAMTSLAGGNVPVAIFNATLSSFIGVFATPLLMAWFAATTGYGFPLGEVILKVSLLVLLPIVVGQVAHRWLGPWAARNSTWLRLVDRIIILAIVYGSFCDSMVAGIWSEHEPSLIGYMIVGAILLFAVVYWLMTIACRVLGFDREDTIAAVFCGSKKSLATGVPVATIMFAGSPALGLIIAPLMIYHFSQLVIVSVIANRYAAEKAAVPARP